MLAGSWLTGQDREPGLGRQLERKRERDQGDRDEGVPPAPTEGKHQQGTERVGALEMRRNVHCATRRPCGLSAGNVVTRRNVCTLRKTLGERRQVQNQDRASTGPASWELGERTMLAKRL